MWVHNCSQYHIALGVHPDAGPCGVLIQIADTHTEFITPKCTFSAVHRYMFDDASCSDEDDPPACLITREQAASIMGILYSAYRSGANVIVQCPVGLSRSGAVVEIAALIGFEPTETYRLPSLSVKYALIEYF